MSQVHLASLARESHLMIVAGSVCKDFSTLGARKGFLGQYVLLCGIFIALCVRIKPCLAVHECTAKFPYDIFREILSDYEDHHTLINSSLLGMPVQRNRAWDAIINKKFRLLNNINAIHELSVKCVLDAAVWLQGSSEEASCVLLR